MSNYYETRKILNGIKSLGQLGRDIADLPKIYIGQKVVILCNRYIYRGILVDVVGCFVILSNCRTTTPHNITVNGGGDCICFSDAKNLSKEDDVDGPMFINVRSIESISRPPKWIDGPLTDEEKTLELLEEYKKV